jgi:hypothetical protein
MTNTEICVYSTCALSFLPLSGVVFSSGGTTVPYRRLRKFCGDVYGIARRIPLVKSKADGTNFVYDEFYCRTDPSISLCSERISNGDSANSALIFFSLFTDSRETCIVDNLTRRSFR